VGLQNPVKNFNGLAQNSISYRCTIPKLIYKQFQMVEGLLGNRAATQIASVTRGRSTRWLPGLARAGLHGFF
jgi:hypothetical protein